MPREADIGTGGVYEDTQLARRQVYDLVARQNDVLQDRIDLIFPALA